MAKRLLEAILAVAVEESVRRFLPPLLPYVWLTILLLLTWEILNAKPVKARVAHLANRLKGRHRVTAYVVAAVVSAALGIFYLWGIKHAFSYFGEPEAGLHATFKTELLDLSRNLNDAAMWVLYPSGYGSTISPVALVAFVEITNLYSYEVGISSYSMAIKTDTCGWVYLSPIDARGVTLLHSSGDLRTTQALNASRSFSVQWSDPIPAHKTQCGIFLFDTKIPCAVQAGSPVQFKLELTDSTGKSFPLLSPDMAILKNLQPGTSIGTGNLATLELIGRTVDVSKAYRRYHSDPMPDAIGNEVERGTAVITPQGKTGTIALDDGAYSLAR